VLTKTRTGLSIRAVAQDQLGSVLNGINTRRVYSITLGVATVFAGIAGALLGPIYFVEPHTGDLPMIKAFVIVILGGIGSFRGTIVAAFIVAIVEVLVGTYIGVLWAPLSLFLLLIAILILKPEGLFGISTRKA
jgi:branched-chain amino acid transport system permease protein